MSQAYQDYCNANYGPEDIPGPERPKARRYILSGGVCVTCSQWTPGDAMMPPHDASPRCESGKRNHCTCDTCF